MKILFFAQKMPDPCGAFFHDLYLAYYLRSKGHSVKFITVGAKQPRQGMYRNMPFSYIDISGHDLESANMFCCPHFPFLNTVRKYNERFEKPILITAHFGEDLMAIEKNNSYGAWPEFLWVISNHIFSYIKENITITPSIKEMRSIRPVIDLSSIGVFTYPEKPSGNCITLINANILKGVHVLEQLAKRFPNRNFLGVKPYYNPIHVPNLKNIEWIDIQDDVREIIKKTRILIVPSAYESWGRVAFEAMYNGIPVLYSKPSNKDQHIHKSGTTEGMKEWIQTNAIECDRDCIEDWINAIISLDDDDLYFEN
jgi:glycosyltransferase involved in cell wall biosynthesis